ncbi:MAG: DNA-3-methyladenine glycosylase [Solirubrobacterales bacterium]
MSPSAPATLPVEFYDRPVNEVARELIGCTLSFGGSAGVIVETEAYDATDPACHAYNGRTARNQPLFGPPARAYVYLSYGIHHLLNFVAEPENSPAAVLIRALEPTAGVEQMRGRRGPLPQRDLCSGPGKLTQALGIGPGQNGASLLEPPFLVSRPGAEWLGVEVASCTRIGISKALDLPWRYCAAQSPCLSAPLPRVSPGRSTG